MKKLFIIGNGFDLCHGLKTSYNDFQEYLQEEYPEADTIDFVPEYIIDGRGNYEPRDENEVIGFIRNILDEVEGGDKWRDLELSVGEINPEDYMSDYIRNEKNDSDLWHEWYYNEDTSIDLVSPILKILFYFDQWISTVKINEILPMQDFANLINKDSDFFLSFNYTKTLEYVYDVNNVCHIHGVQGEELYFGHGENLDYFSDEVYGVKPGTEENFQRIHYGLKKDTQKALEKNKVFFENLSRVNKIYSYGFSFSEVDEIYIKKICNSIDTESITWYLNKHHDKNTREIYENKISNCGFKGSFDVF